MIALSALSFRGRGLVRPECVLAHASGNLFVADWHGAGGVAIVRPDGSVRRITARGGPAPLRPNGIALEDGGTFLVAHLGDHDGGVFRLHPDGHIDPVVTELDGRPLPPTNFVLPDGEGRLWVTVSTRHDPRHDAAKPGVADGFVVLVPPGGAPRIVADGLGYTNECLVSADGAHLVLNETFGKATSRFPIRGDGSLGAREVIATWGEGTFPDGLVADAEGGLWVTSIVSNRVIRVHPDGRQEVVLEDADPDAMAETERRFAAGTLDTARLGHLHGRVLANVSSLAFGGPDLATAFLGCLKGDAIATFPAPVRGAPPLHYTADLSRLAEAGLLDDTTDLERTSP